MEPLHGALSGVTRLGMDTSPIIYFVEISSSYNALVTEIFLKGIQGDFALYTSVVTLTEVLVQPIRQGNNALLKACRSLLAGSDDFTMFQISAIIAESAAGLRARYNLRTPDALQIAAALEAGCEAFLTNDHALKRVTDLRVLVLDELAL